MDHLVAQKVSPSIVRISPTARATLAIFIACSILGSAMAARVSMIATTMSSSTNENPLLRAPAGNSFASRRPGRGRNRLAGATAAIDLKTMASPKPQAENNVAR